MNRNNLILFVSLIALLFVWIFTPLIDEDEGLMAEISREMLQSQDFLSPKMNGELRFDKPPFFNWLQVISFYIFGLNQFAARLPAIIFGGFWILFTYKIAISISTLKSNVELNSLIYLFFCSFQIIILSIAGIQESVNNSCFCAIIYFLFFDLKTKSNLKKIYISVFLSISFLTKGPLVLGLILLIILFKYFIDKFDKNTQNKETIYSQIKILFSFKTIFIFLVLTSPWYVFMFQNHGLAFSNGFFFNHNLNRFLSTKESHRGNLFYYLFILIVGNSAIFPAIIHAIVLEFKQNKTSILLIIPFIIILFFSCSATKLHHYIVIAYPALIVMVFKHQSQIKFSNSFLVFFVFKLIFLLALILFYFENSFIKEAYFRAILMDSKREIMQFSIVIFCLIILNMFFKKYNHIFHLSFLNFIFTLSFFYFVGNAMQKPIREMATRIKTENQDLKVSSHYHPSLSFYSNRILKMGEEQKAVYIFGNLKELKNQVGELIYSKSGLGLKKRMLPLKESIR